ncbi:MAG TPA: CHAT domain-containing protein [Kribbella sp.]
MTTCRSCETPAPALDGLGEPRIVTDLDVSGIVELLTGELDYARCDAGCRLNVRAAIVFQDTEESIEYVGSSDELRPVVLELLDKRIRVFLPLVTGGPDGTGDVRYLHSNWRKCSAWVMATVGVALSGRVPAIGFFGTQHEHVEFVFESRQTAIWTSMLVDWTNGRGVGSFEEDLQEHVDRTTFLGDPLRHLPGLDDLPYPASYEARMMDTYRREALRASIYARVGQPNPHANRWAVIWLWWDLRLRIAGGAGVSQVPDLAVSVERLRKTVPPGSAHAAGTATLNDAMTECGNGNLTEDNLVVLSKRLNEVFVEVGFGDQLSSIYASMSAQLPIDEIADRILERLPITRDSIPLCRAWTRPLVETRRVDDLERLVDAMCAAVPTEAIDTSLWYVRQLLEMRMPARVLAEIGALEKERLTATERGQLLEPHAEALRALGRQPEALAVLEAAPPEVLNEPSNKQALGIARARLLREAGFPAAALALLETLLAEVDDPKPSLHETLLATLMRFGRYREAAGHGRAAYSRALGKPSAWPVGLFAAQTMWCQAIDGREPDADLVEFVLSDGPSANANRDLVAAIALLTAGVARREFLDRVRASTDAVLRQAIVERDVRLADKALYVAALYDQTYRPDKALGSWTRLVSVMLDRFDVQTEAFLYTAANLIARDMLDLARDLLKKELGYPGPLGHDSGLATGALAGVNTVREVDLVTGNMFSAPDATPADLRLVGELRRGKASRATPARDEQPAWRRNGLEDDVVAAIAPVHGRVGVLEWISDGTEVRALVTGVDAAGSVASTTVPLPDVDLSRVARRMRSRLSTWRAGRAGDPFGVDGWQACRAWLDSVLDDHLAPDDHLVVVPFAGWRELPWHVAAFDRVTCSYEPSWVALLSTVDEEPQRDDWWEGVVAVPRMGDPEQITGAMTRYVAECGDEALVLEGVAADRAAVTDLLTCVDLATLLTHGYTSASETEVALMLAADGALPLAHSVAAASERGRGHRFGWREYAELPSAPRVILSAACSTGGGHIVGLGEHLGIYNVLRQVGLRAFVAPQWDIVAADVLPILAEIRAGLLRGHAGLGQEVWQAVRAAIDRGVPAWSAHALILEGDWR